MQRVTKSSKYLVDNWELIRRWKSSSFDNDIEDPTQIFSWQRFLLDDIFDLANKHPVDLLIHHVVIDVSDLREDLEKPNHIRVA